MGVISSCGLTKSNIGYDFCYDDRSANGFDDRIRTYLGAGSGTNSVYDAQSANGTAATNALGLYSATSDPTNTSALKRFPLLIRGLLS